MAISDGHVPEGDAALRSVFGFSGGFGGHRKAYAAFLGAYADATGRETAFFTSRRRGTPVTRP